MKDETGNIYGRLTVESLSRITNKGAAVWRCRCICGNVVDVFGYNLRSEHTASCGCFMSDKSSTIHTSHGMSKTRIYQTWKNMKKRCKNENSTEYDRYGGRGISVCTEWSDNFSSFYEWAISSGYRENLTIDRINSNGNYEPSNCRWITQSEQNQNRTSNRIIEYNGEKHNLAEWSNILNIKYSVLLARISKLGWSYEKAFTTPVRRCSVDKSV